MFSVASSHLSPSASSAVPTYRNLPGPAQELSGLNQNATVPMRQLMLAQPLVSTSRKTTRLGEYPLPMPRTLLLHPGVREGKTERIGNWPCSPVRPAASLLNRQ